MFEKIKNNLAREKQMIEEARVLRKAIISNPDLKEKYKPGIISLLKQINMLNGALPKLLKKRPETKKSEKTVQISYRSPSSKEKNFITINSSDKEKYLEHLKLSEDSLKNIKKLSEENRQESRKPNEFAKISNKVFRKISEKISPQFSSLSVDLKKANIHFLLSTYISMALFSSTISLLVGILIFATLILIDSSNIIHFWIVLVLPLLTFLMFYIYPAGEAKSLQKKISRELPFATIHMAAIAGSDIEPTKIFKILVASKEYPGVGAEIQKVISQVEIYGYDLVTSLKNVAKLTSNEKLAELLGGLATNISTGGELKDYLEKKAENFLLDYRLERKRYSDLAGTFMDIYISILIAAPLIFMMMFIIMKVAGLGLEGIGISTLMSISIVGVGLINILFLIILNFKQPKV